MKKLLIAVLFILVGCAEECELIQTYEGIDLLFCEEAEIIPANIINIKEEDQYYNVYYNSRYCVEYEGEMYQTVEEINELIELIGPDTLFEVGYRMEKIEVGGLYWDRNY